MSGVLLQGGVEGVAVEQVAVQALAQPPPFVLGEWIASIGHRFRDQTVVDAVLAFLTNEDCTTVEILTTLKYEDFSEFSVGTARLLEKLIVELGETSYPNKRRKTQGVAALHLEGAESGEVVQKTRAKLSYASFINGEELVTIDNKDLAPRVADATLMMRAGDVGRRVIYGIGPPFARVITGGRLIELAADVRLTQAAGTSKEAATNAVQVLWGLGDLAKMTRAGVCGDKDLLSKMIVGKWDKFQWDGLSLRDFHYDGRFAVNRNELVKYSFVRQLKESLEGLELVAAAVFSPTLMGFTAVFRARLDAGYLQLASSTQLMVFALVNDSLVDAFDELRTAVRGIGGASLNGPDSVKGLLEWGLAQVLLPSLEGGPAQVALFNRLRAARYVLGTDVGMVAPATGGGGAKGGGEDMEDQPVVCVDHLRGLFGQRKGATANGNLVVCHYGEDNQGRSCPKLHIQLSEVTKVELGAMVEEAGVTGKTKWAQALRQAIDESTELKASGSDAC